MACWSAGCNKQYVMNEPSPPKPDAHESHDASANLADSEAHAIKKTNDDKHARGNTWGGGGLAWFAGNPVAANLLMVLVLVGGWVALSRMRMEVFPEIASGTVTIAVTYPGASPEEVEEGVCIKIEEALSGISGIKRLRSVAVESQGTVTAELEDFSDKRTVLGDIETAVDRIDTFPDETENPVITEGSSRVQVITVAVYGEVPERSLKIVAERVRDDLTGMSEISQAELVGTRPFEVSIEVAEEALREYGLTFDQVASAIRMASLNLPGGSVKTEDREILIRTQGQRYTGQQFGDIEILSRPDGTVLRVGQIATVKDGFEDTTVRAFFDGKPAVMINIFRIGSQDAVKLADTVRDYIANQRAQMPEGVQLETWYDRSRFIRSRLDLLMRNAVFGLILVFGCLLCFLNIRLALWTTMGIPLSFLGAFWLLSYFDVTLNMISMFAFLVVLGIVVDDAIVISEHIDSYQQAGMNRLAAAVRGVREMALPVTFAVMTTVVAFAPLIFTAGQIGKLVRQIPIVVIAVLLLSLVESLLILPAHLGHSQTRHRKPDDTSRPRTPIGWVQMHVQQGLDRVIRGPYQSLLERVVAARYLTIAIALAILLITMGVVAGGHVGFVFMPKIDADNVLAELTMPRDVPAAQTERLAHMLEQSAWAAAAKIDGKQNGDTSRSNDANENADENAKGNVGGKVGGNVGGNVGGVVKHTFTIVGQQPFLDIVSGKAQQGLAQAHSAAHLAEVNLELQAGEDRDISSTEVASVWRETTGSLPGASSLTYVSSFFSTGNAIDVELAHHDFDTLLRAAADLKNQLSDYAGVEDIADSFLPGKQELKLALRPAGRSLGLTLYDLAKQVRQGFYGEEAQRIQRGRHEVKVMVRYPKAQRESLNDISNIRIRLPDGTEVPFHTVAEATIERGVSEFRRADRRRIVSITGDVDQNVADINAVRRELTQTLLPELAAHYPGLQFQFEGEQREQAESMAGLLRHFGIALLAIYALLGMQFRSYIQPLIVMSAIPFGLIGAVVGHLIIGMELSFLSAFGVVALTGVVVNDSLIMIEFINRRVAGGMPVRDAVMHCGGARFRPIMLTTLTTFFGLTPMIFERSLEAKFLVPVAASLGFGVLFATAITLLLVPAMYMVLVDFTRWRTGRPPASAPTS